MKSFIVSFLAVCLLAICSVLLNVAFAGTVQTTDYLTYMGWAIPIIARMLAPQNTPPEAK